MLLQPATAFTIIIYLFCLYCFINTIFQFNQHSFTTSFYLTILIYLIFLNLLHVTYHLNIIKLSIQL